MSEEEPSRRIIPWEEIHKHNTRDDCWIVIRGKVYDVTPFLDEHPGGVEVVEEVAGQECTEAYDEVNHSEEANEMLQDYYIGDAEGGDAVEAMDAVAKQESSKKKQQQKKQKKTKKNEEEEENEETEEETEAAEDDDNDDEKRTVRSKL